MEAEYLARGWQLTDRHADADLFVVRGCSVTARAQHECEKLIDHLKRHYPAVQIRVCGCLESAEKAPATPSSAVPARTARAYLKVQDGCAGMCTFCIVPKFRGQSRSEAFAQILDRARRFIDSGYREIVVTGCNLSLYASAGKRLPDLIAGLAGLDDGCRIRIGSLEPGACALETVQAMAEHPNVCRFLHLPVQSGSNRTLSAMRRPYGAKDVEETVKLAVRLMPGLGLGCDLMTGFPGETDIDFSATKGLLKRLPFNNAHIFPFSERPGTMAAGFPCPIPKVIRSARTHELSALIREKRMRFARSFVGKTVEIVVEDSDHGRGWTGEYLPCSILAGQSARKALVRVSVTNAKDDLLCGRLTQ